MYVCLEENLKKQDIKVSTTSRLMEVDVWVSVQENDELRLFVRCVDVVKALGTDGRLKKSNKNC